MSAGTWGARGGCCSPGALYTAGRTLAYLVLGAAAVWSLMSVVSASSFLQGSFSRLIGPMLIWSVFSFSGSSASASAASG